MNRSVFFDAIRPTLGGTITSTQVKVVEAIMDLGSTLSAEHMAYILATAWGESNLTPRRENMNYTAARIRAVWPKRPEAVKFAGKPRELANSVYGSRLGNRPGSDDGWLYRGGGLDQLTGRYNYRAVGIEGTPEAILQPDRAARSIVHGMTTGRYRGFKLGDFGDGAKFNAVAARAILNDDVKLHGEKYAAHWRAFLAALKWADWGYVPATPVTPPDTSVPSTGSSPIAAILNLILRLFGVKA